MHVKSYNVLMICSNRGWRWSGTLQPYIMWPSVAKVSFCLSFLTSFTLPHDWFLLLIHTNSNNNNATPIKTPVDHLMWRFDDHDLVIKNLFYSVLCFLCQIQYWRRGRVQPFTRQRRWDSLSSAPAKDAPRCPSTRASPPTTSQGKEPHAEDR